MRGLIGAAMLIATTTPLAAQEPDNAVCPAPMTPPAPWRGWSSPAPLVAAESDGARAAARLAPGNAVSVTLAPAHQVAFVVPPARRGGPISYGGMLMLAVPVAGTYRVALGAPAWIDVVSSGRAMASTAHQHCAPCSGVVKLVDFVLPAGPAAIELSGAPGPVMTAMVVRVS